MITTSEPKNKSISLVGSQYALSNAAPLSPDDYRDLVKRRAVSILHLTPDEHAWDNNEELRRETETLILEKINKESNLLPIDFLSKGVERAKSICRIVTPSGFGTGFLIDKWVVMTNHHVIQSADEAENCFAEFGYEDNQNPIKVKLKPSDLFITSPFEELDFTIVGCDSSGSDDIIPIKLLRSPTTITRGEYANIIQHPKGRKKEVALQDNTISYVYDKVIHYTTDTEPGSSGSAVFNNQWQLVALHHAGWYTDKSQQNAINEGIRISAIVSKLVALAQVGDSGALRLTQKLEGTSPYLGFYDVEGLIDNPDDLAEIEIPTFKGDKRFADIGFWNIENFNNTVQEQRVKAVAQIVADMSMDTLGLVEVEKGALEQLVNTLKDRGAAMDYVYLEAEGAQDLAVLFDTTTTKVELKDDINHRYSKLLRSTVNGKPAFPKKREPLFALCTVKEEKKDVQFLMIVVHLKAMRDKISKQRRTAAAETLAVIIEDLKQDDKFKHLPIVLGGDLNDDAGSTSLTSVMNSPSVITLTTDDALAGHISYLKAPHSLIDHIIITKDMKTGSIQNDGQTDDAAIVRLDKTIADFVKNISDHAPLVLRVIYKDESQEQERGRAWLTPVYLANENTLERTLLRLSLNQFKLEEEQPYYDAEKDKLDIVNYYRSIQFQGNGTQLFRQLHGLLLDTHTTIFTYKQSRNHLYSEVDLHEDRTLRSIYSGNKLDPEMLIQEDFRIEQLRKEFLENKESLERLDEESLEEMFEEKMQFNTEHVVPQSWFNKKSPMVSDLHHLFTCESDCNSFRSNIPYFDFADYNPEAYREQLRNECGKRGGNIRFEPENGKGEVARAVLYFLLRYPSKIGKEKVNVELLLNWHKEHPVTIHEKHRNRAIYELQGNRNPLIDFPESAEQIDFTSGV
ncbi:endonuclease [Pelosinus baikalensis]|uniref:endonuclease n=1 Tax=Pelosinus baikalensis TaxID=2892015 RepID=UPI0034E21D25